jgi:hypothetical protein
MYFPNIDKYIAKFEELAQQAGYTAGNLETIHTFIKGLMPTVMEDVLKLPQGYHTIKQKVIECTWSRVLLDNILKAWQPSRRGFSGNAFRGFQHGGAQRQPFFSRQNVQNQQGPPPRYTSSNMPPWMNNQPVPMDVRHNRAPNYCRRGASA